MPWSKSPALLTSTSPEARPAPAVQRVLRSGQRVMRYDIFGNADADAATIVLSAGLGGLVRFWRPQFEALGQRFRVITYDHRGTGKNAESLSDGYAIADMADDVVEILDNAGVACCHFI